MAYFNLKIISSERGFLYETDLQPHAFQLFAQIMGNQFAQQGLFRPTEFFKMRLIPQWDEKPNFLKFELVDSAGRLSKDDPEVDILLEKPVQDKPVDYFTVRWLPQDRGVAYQLDFKISALFEGTLRLVLDKLFEKNILNEGEEFRYEVFVRDQGTPKIDKDTQPTSKYSIQYVRIPKEASKPPKQDIKLSIKSKVSLIEPKHRKRSRYTTVEMIDQPRSSALGVYMNRNAYLKVKEDVKVSKIKQIEVAGILLGEIFEDNGLYIDISETVPVEEAVGSFYSVRIDSEVWQNVMENANAQHPGKILVGWYHTHLISKVKIDTEDSSSGVVKASQQTFLSQDDLFIHNNFFTQPWHVAMVIDLRAGRDVFFYRFSNELVDAGGFYLYNEISE